MYLAYVRHGLSQANIDGIVAGHLDTPLTDIGRQQAQEIAWQLQDINFQHAYSSPLARARETLEVILSELKLLIAPSFHDALKERNWGDIEGRDADGRAEEFSQEVVDSWFEWEGRPPGGESYADMSSRVVGFFDEVIKPKLLQNENVLVVAHNGISKPLQRYLERLPHESTNKLNLRNCEVKLYLFDEHAKLIRVESRCPIGATQSATTSALQT